MLGLIFRDERESFVMLDKHFIHKVVLPNYSRERLAENFGSLSVLKETVKEIGLNFRDIFRK